MRMIQKIAAGCIGLCLFACTETDELRNAEGKTGFVVSLTDGTKLDVSRATPGEIVESEGIEGTDFHLLIVNEETKEPIYNDKVTTETINAYSGIYTLTATYGENPILALDAPYFKGEVNGVEVFSGQTTPVTIPCKVANALVSVAYDESKAKFSDVYSDYYVEVKAGSATVQIDKTGEKSAYMQAGSTFEVIFHGTLKEGSEEKQINLDLSEIEELPLQAGDHLKLTLSPKLDRFDIPLKVEGAIVEEASLSEEIPLDWLPKPKVEAEGFEGNTLNFVETEAKDAKLNLKLSSALQDIRFKFNFTDKQYLELNRDTGYLYINPADKEIINNTLGVTVANNQIDLNGLTTKIQTNAGESTTNTIEVDVKANNRWSSEDENANRVYTLICNKPVFHVDAYPGNIWTKEFTMNALREEQVESGDFTTLSGKMTYQFSVDGETDWTDLGTDLRQANLQPGTSYYIRGLYRGEVAGEKTMVTTYAEIPLTNGGLENAEELSGDDSSSFGGTVYGWNGWATLNKISAPTGAACYSFNSRSGCRPTSDSYKGDAIRVITLGYGVGGWAKPEKAMHSKLYLGVSADQDGNGIVNGITFESRPSHLTFWYKCISNKGNDESLVQIKLLHDDVVLGEGQFTTGATNNTYTEKTIEIDYSKYLSNLTLSPNKLQIVFQSGIKEPLNIDDDLESFINRWNTVDKTADATYRGNELFVDEVSLEYNK